MDIYGIIYCTTNLINNKKYIGQTIHSLEERKLSHIKCASNKRKQYFHNAIHKYGEDKFYWEVIDVAFTKEELDSKERFWIKELKTLKKEHGYNIAEGGSFGNGFAGKTIEEMDSLRKIMSDKAKQRIERDGINERLVDYAKKQKGTKFTEEHRENMSKAARNRDAPSKETREKISKARKGWKMSEEQKEMLRKNGGTPWSSSQRDKYNKYLETRSDEHKEALTKKRLETRARLQAEGMRDYSMPAHVKNKLIEINKNKKVSDEQRKKISEYQQEFSPARKKVIAILREKPSFYLEFPSIISFCEYLSISYKVFYKYKKDSSFRYEILIEERR